MSQTTVECITVKRCSRCHEEKSSSEFAKSAREASGFQSWCRTCLMEYGRARPKVHIPTVVEKRCSTCKVLKQAQEFCKDIHKPTGLRSQCRQCRKQIRSEKKMTRRNLNDEALGVMNTFLECPETQLTTQGVSKRQRRSTESSFVKESTKAQALRKWALLTAIDLATTPVYDSTCVSPQHK